MWQLNTESDILMKTKIKNLIQSLERGCQTSQTFKVNNKLVNLHLRNDDDFYILGSDPFLVMHFGSKYHIKKVLKQWLNNKRELILFEETPILQQIKQ